MRHADTGRARRVPALVLLPPEAGGARESPSLKAEERLLAPGDRIELIRRRSRWDGRRDIARVLVGTHSTRADVRLLGPGVKPEHFRLYYPLRGEGHDDFRPLQAGTAVNGRALAPLEYVPLQPGDEIALLDWRFRYEVEWRSDDGGEERDEDDGAVAS